MYDFIEIPPVENLMAVDNCTHVTVSWDITGEGACKLSYNVLLTSLKGGVMPQTNMTNDTSLTFSVEPSIGFRVNVYAFNDSAIGPNLTAMADVNAPNG